MHVSHSLPRLPAETTRRLTCSTLAGRLSELSGWERPACLTIALRLIAEIQRDGRQAAWVTCAAPHPHLFYAPDAAQLGVSLALLPIVVTPDVAAAGRALTHLLRSGAFGLVVLDLIPLMQATPTCSLPLPLQARLAGLAQRHASVFIVLTAKPADAPSLGSLVSLHAHLARRRPAPPSLPLPLLQPCVTPPSPHTPTSPAIDEREFDINIVILKDKRQGPGRPEVEHGAGPPELG